MILFGFFSGCFQRPSDSERLLQRNLRDAEEGLELRDDYASPPIWMDKLEEAQYTISKYERTIGIGKSLNFIRRNIIEFYKDSEFICRLKMF